MSKNATEIQKELDEKTALLEYVVGDSILHVFCVDKKEVTWKQIAINTLLISFSFT